MGGGGGGNVFPAGDGMTASETRRISGSCLLFFQSSACLP